MRKITHKNILFRVVFCTLAAILTLSVAPVPKASATESYFYAEGSTLLLNELDPEEEPTVTITLRAAREMDLRNISGHFTPTAEDDTELELVPIIGIKPYGMSIYCSWEDDGYFGWNTEDCHSEYHGYADDIHFNVGDPIFEATYTVKPDVLLATRSLPVTIDSATIVENEEPVIIGDITTNAEVIVRPAEVFYTIDAHKEGDGSIIAPTIALPDEETEIKVTPDEYNKLYSLTINGQDVTNQVENNTITINVTEDLDIYAIFRVIDPSEEETDDGSEGKSPLVPDTGAMTNDDNNSKSIGSPLILTLIGAIAAVSFLLKKQIKNLKGTK